MNVPVSCIKINLKKPIMFCRVLDVQKPIQEEVKQEEDTEFKRKFSARLGEAMKGLVLGKKSIQSIEKPKRKRRRRRKKHD